MTKCTTIADQNIDEHRWKLERRRYVTASDILKFLPESVLLERGWWIEGWMARDHEGTYHDLEWVRRDIFDRKLTGRELKFGDPTAVRWGQREEDHNRELFGEYSWCDTEGSHKLLGNERWPYLAASLDGFIRRPKTWDRDIVEIDMFDNPAHVVAAIECIPPGSTCLLEMKQTSDYGVKFWQSGKKTTRSNSKVLSGVMVPKPASVPVYYLPQVLTQLAIHGMYGHCVVVVKGGASHMTAHTIVLDSEWLGVLDSVNQRVEEEVLAIRKVLDATE